MDTFLDTHLVPLLSRLLQKDGPEKNIAIVSHGLILHALWRRLLTRLPNRSVTCAPGLPSREPGLSPIHSLPGWRNTAYVEFSVRKLAPLNHVRKRESGRSTTGNNPPKTGRPSKPNLLFGTKTTLLKVNFGIHLIGLRRIGGESAAPSMIRSRGAPTVSSGNERPPLHSSRANWILLAAAGLFRVSDTFCEWERDDE